MKSLPSPSPEVRDAFCRAARGFSIEALSAGLVATLAREALVSCGKLQQRKSPLQPLLVLWFVLCMTLYRQDSIPAVFSRLLLALRPRIPGLPRTLVTDGALAHARRRLGAAPLRRLFVAIGRSVPPGPLFHGHRCLAIDGTSLDMPDTPANARAFGRHRSQHGLAAWPQSRLLVLLDVSSRTPLDAALAPCHTSEKVVARALLRRSLLPEDLLLLDAGFYGVPFFLRVLRRQAHFLCPAPVHARLEPIGPVRCEGGVRDYRAVMVSRVPLGDGRNRVVRMEVRVLQYQVPGFRPRRLVTSLLDLQIPGAELVALYHSRWEVESAFDEIKTVLCHTPAGAPPTVLRSKSPQGVRQEVFALLTAHALVRRTMALAVHASDVPPTRLSFTDSLHILTQTALVMAGAPASELPRLFEQMLQDIASCVIDRPKRPRRYPRHVKLRDSKYSKKKPHSGSAA